MGKLKSFVKETVARITGDNAQVIAEKNYRKGTSAVSAQIAALRAKLVDDENAVEDAKDTLNSAQHPTAIITDNQSYINSIKAAYNRLKETEESVQTTKESIAYFEELLASFDQEVEA